MIELIKNGTITSAKGFVAENTLTLIKKNYLPDRGFSTVNWNSGPVARPATRRLNST